MLAIIVRNSFFISLLKKVPGAVYRLKRWKDNVYEHSQTYRLIRTLLMGTKNNFKYSFLGRITEKGIGYDTVIWDNSRFIRYPSDLASKWKVRISDYLRTKYFPPVKAIGVVVLAVVLIEAIFPLAMNKGVAFMGWIIKGALLFAGLAGLFCEANLKDLVGTSLFLRWISHQGKSDSEEE